MHAKEDQHFPITIKFVFITKLEGNIHWDLYGADKSHQHHSIFINILGGTPLPTRCANPSLIWPAA